MTRRRITLLAGLIAALAGVPARAAEPAATRPTTRPEVAVVYADHGSPGRLTAGQAEQVGRAATALAPDGRAAWFVLVRSNHLGAAGEGAAGDMLHATIYYAPDASSPRLRKGRAVGLTLFGRKLRSGEPVPYLQVSPGDAPFPDPPGVPGVPAVPALADLPFGPPLTGNRAPAEVGGDDLVRLVDAARAILRADAAKTERWARHQGPDARAHAARERNEPIHRIEKDGDVLRVYTGWQTGIRSGGGRFVDLRRAGGEYRQISEGIGLWRS